MLYIQRCTYNIVCRPIHCCMYTNVVCTLYVVCIYVHRMLYSWVEASTIDPGTDPLWIGGAYCNLNISMMLNKWRWGVNQSVWIQGAGFIYSRNVRHLCVREKKRARAREELRYDKSCSGFNRIRNQRAPKDAADRQPIQARWPSVAMNHNTHQPQAYNQVFGEGV